MVTAPRHAPPRPATHVVCGTQPSQAVACVRIQIIADTPLNGYYAATFHGGAGRRLEPVLEVEYSLTLHLGVSV